MICRAFRSWNRKRRIKANERERQRALAQRQASAAWMRREALAKVADAERRGDDRDLGRARMEAMALTNAELRLAVSR